MIPYTKLKEHNRHNLRDVIPLPKPYTLIIEPTSLCNFKCIQCFHSISQENYFRNNRMNLDIERFNKTIDHMKNWQGPKLKVLKLSLYGEPLINPLFCEMLRIVRDSEISERIETTTNASLLTEEICIRLIEYGLDYLRVSIYSAVQAKHQRITNSKMDISTIRDNLLMLKRIKNDYRSVTPFVCVKMLNTYSDDDKRFYSMYEDVADEIYLDKPHGWISHKGEDFIDNLYGVDAYRAREDLSLSSSARIACTLPFFTLAVRSNGDVSPCCIDWIGGTNMGNIDRESLDDIWNGDRLFEFRKMQLENRKEENESCRNCRLYQSDYYTRDNIDGFPVERLRLQKK